MKCRYITAKCSPNDPICNFRLISHRIVGQCCKGPGMTCVRVRIPDDLVLEKCSCDDYSTTDDTRTIEELGYEVEKR